MTPAEQTQLLRLLARAWVHEEQAMYNIDQYRLDEARKDADEAWAEVERFLEEHPKSSAEEIAEAGKTLWACVLHVLAVHTDLSESERAQLQDASDHWQRVQAKFQDGINFGSQEDE